MDKKVRIGVLGGARGGSMINYCERSDNAVVVAICDKNPEVLETQRRTLRDDRITYYDNFEDFLRHDMDAVVLANYANEHAPFAIRAMRRGLHVFSEVLPCQTMKEAVDLAEAVRDMGYMPEQVQDFYPTPSTMSTCMYYTGVDPRTMEPIYVARDPHEKAMQRALIQYRDPKNHDLVMEALRKAGRADLIGFGPKCLIRPYKGEGGHGAGAKKGVAGAKNAGKRGGSPNGGRSGKSDGARGKAPRR